jgi:PAS domain S-box-containing protein
MRYGVPIVAVILALLIKLLVDTLNINSDKNGYFSLIFMAILISVLYGGIKRGMLTSILAAFLQVKKHQATRSRESKTTLATASVASVVNTYRQKLQGDRAIPTQKQETTQDALQILSFHLENSPLAVIEWDSNFRVIKWSQQAETLFGWESDQLMGKHPSEWKFVLPEDLASVNGVVSRLLNGSERRNISHNRNYTKDGSIVYCEWYNSALVDESGNVVSVLSLILDITERQQTETALRKSEERLRLSLDAGVMGIWDWNILTGELAWSDTLEPMNAIATGSGTFADFVEKIYPEDREFVEKAIAQSVEQKTNYAIEFRIISPNGNICWIGGKGQVFCDETGNAVRMLGVCMDITENKRSQEQQQFLVEASTLLSNSLDYQTTLETLAHLAVPHLADWCCVDILDEEQTPRRLAVIHVDPSKVEWAQQLHQRYPPDMNEPYGLAKVLRTGQAELYPEIPDSLLVEVARDAEQLELLRQIGYTSAMIVPLVARGRTLGAITFVWAESNRHYNESDLIFASELARRAALAVDNARLFQTVEQELTERKRSQAALQESEERFRTMADSAPVLLWMSGTDGLCNFFNQSWLTFGGRTLEQEMGNGWTQGVHPDDFQRCLDTYMTAFHVRENFQMEYRLLRADGEYRWVLDTGRPRFTPDGTFAGYIGSCVDISERKKAEEDLLARAEELARLSGILAQTNTDLEKRNKELDQFAYIVSHDLKAPLRAIANLSTWIEEDIEDKLDPETRRNMDLLRGRVHRMEALINALLQYSRVGRVSKPPELVNVATLLTNIIGSLAAPPTFTITIEPEMPTLFTGRLLLEQVFANLLSNCIKHHPRSEGNVTISVQNRETCYEFAVADDGNGIAPQYHEKVFVMFQTLEARDKVENTGVGLAIVKKIIEQQGGTIWLKSQLGQGATFYFTWPKQPKSK